VVILFRKGFARRETDDRFRRGVVTGALAGCFAVLVHSFFDFTLHTTANALLFLILTRWRRRTAASIVHLDEDGGDVHVLRIRVWKSRRVRRNPLATSAQHPMKH